MAYNNVILIGPQGSGKGAQAEYLKKDGYLHVSTGELIRAKKGSKKPQDIEAIRTMNGGGLSADDYVLGLVREAIAGQDALLFDGFPRTVAQAEALDNILQIDLVLSLNITDDEAIRRLLGRKVCGECNTVYGLQHGDIYECPCGGELYQREDDNEEAIMKRLGDFTDETKPVIDHYRAKSLVNRGSGPRARFVDVSANLPEADVASVIREIMTR